MSPGDYLLKLCQSATQDLWLVAPFVKAATLQRLLEGVSHDVNIQCVTRWRPEEIAMGVSDIEVWPLLKTRANSRLWLRHDLHAKYYRADSQCLMGSANITATALGWTTHPNLELLIDVSPQHPALIGFEKELLSEAIVVNDDIYQHTQLVVALLEKEKPLIVSAAEDQRPSQGVARDTWIPTLRNPEKLYLAYIGNQDRLTMGVYESAVIDLQTLSLPSGLSKTAFDAYIGYMLLQMPIISKIDAFVKKPRRFGEVSAYLKQLPCSTASDFDAKHSWQTLMRWLLYFLPKRYQHWVDSHTEIIKHT